MSLGNGAALCASSALAPQKTNTYGVDNMLDGRLETAWIEAARGLGVGEYVALDLGSKASFREIDLINGYSKSASLHAKHSRIAILRVTASNGRSQDLRLRDTSAWQSHTLDGFEDVRWVKLEIVRAIRGLQWEDTAISELRLR